MKKHLLKIIILVIIFGGFFSLARPTPVYAEACTGGTTTNPTPTGCVGTCSYQISAGGVQVTKTDQETRDQCAQKNPPFGGTFSFTSSSGNTSMAIVNDPAPDYNYGCDIPYITDLGCYAALSYGIWYISAPIARLAGHFLDFFIYYSTNDESYRNTFVTQGWGVVRDVANIFFIVALLYIAIKTVLNLDSSGSKKLIVNVIIVALVINFSLFTTKVVIDSSNILAKVFYNKITPVSSDGTPTTGASGQKSISIGLVNKYNPQDVVSSAEAVATPATFIFITLFLITITLYTAYIFFAVALLFVGRVVSLWMSMIFAPLAFISYTVPFDIPGFGHKKWWDELLKNAFLAPLFIFFLYIIVLFADFLKNIGVENTGSTSFDKVMGVAIPFIILIVLLSKAKKLAVEYSGAMGQAVMSVGKMVGGVALGAATGGAAMLGTGALGNLASRMASSKTLNAAQTATGLRGFAARTALRVADYGKGASFDIRKIPGAGAIAKATGMNLQSASALGLGSKEGGYEKRRADKVKKRQERAKSLEVREDEELKQSLNKTEAELQALLGENAREIESIDKTIEKKRQEADDALRRYNAVKDTKGPGETAAELAARTDAKTALEDANTNLASIKQAKKDLREGRAYSHTDVGAATPSVSGTAVGTATRNIDSLEKQQKIDAQAIKTENIKRRHAYAKRLGNRHGSLIAISKAATMALTGNTLGVSATLGLGALGHPVIGGAMALGALALPFTQEDKRANREAVHKIIMETKLDSGEKSH